MANLSTTHIVPGQPLNILSATGQSSGAIICWRGRLVEADQELETVGAVHRSEDTKLD